MFHILLVEDDEEHARRIQRAFERAAMGPVHVVSDLQQARAHLDAHEVDLVLAGAALPDGSGMMLLDVTQRPLPVIILARNGDVEEAVAAMRAGALDYRMVPDEPQIAALPAAVQPALTARRHHSGRLQRSEARYRALFDHSQEAILLADDDARYVDVNPAACALTGYSRAELLQRTVWELTPEMNRQQGEAMWQHFIAAGESEGDFTMQRKDGRLVETEFRAVANILPGLHLSIIRDVTEKRLTEDALRTSEQRFRIVLKASSIVAAISDLDLRYVWIQNPHHDFDSQTVIGKRDDELSDGKGILQLMALKRQVIAEETGKREEITFHRSDGFRTFDITAEPVRDAQGRVIGVTTAALDITDRKKMEKALRMRERELIEAQRLANLGNWQLDVVNDTLTWSEQIYEIFGITKGDFEETFDAFFNFVHPDDREIMMQAQNAVLAGEGDLNLEHRIIRADGAIRYVHEIAEATFDEEGAPIILRGTVHDITQRKKAEIKTQEANEQLRAMFAASPAAIIKLAPDGTVLLWSPAAEQIFGWQAKEVVGRPYPLIGSPRLATEFRQNMARLSQGETFAIMETQRQRKDDTLIDVSMSLAPVYDKAGEVTAIVGILADITERKEAQRRLQVYAQRLEMLHQIDRAILQLDSPEQIAQTAVDHLAKLIACDRISAGWFDETKDTATVLAAYSTEASALRQGVRVPMSENHDFFAAIRRGETYIITDLAQEAAPSPAIERLLRDGLRSYMTVPLLADGELLGTLSLGAKAPNYFDGSYEHFVKEVANQVAIALQQAQLRAAEQEQRRLAEALRDTAVALSRAETHNDIYKIVLTNVGRVISADVLAFVHVEDGVGRVTHVVGAPETELLQLTFPSRPGNPLQQLIEQEAILVPDTHRQVGWPQRTDLDWIRSVGAKPVHLDDQLLGFIALVSKTPGKFTDGTIQKLTGFAEQTAVALERLRLVKDLEAYAETLEQRVVEGVAALEAQHRQQAALKERQRLAQELHDVVSQSLFTASLIAETLPRLWQRNPAAVQQGLDELQRLTKGALAEMRTLLLEMRPERLSETPPGDLIQRLVDALSARIGAAMEVEVKIVDEATLPPEVHHAVYRVAQEALNNVAKHAQATAVGVTFINRPEETTLTVQDDGVGFVPAQVPPDHLGLEIMHERAYNIGAILTIETEPGSGTTVNLFWQR